MGGGWPTFGGPVPPGPNVEPPLLDRLTEPRFAKVTILILLLRAAFSDYPKYSTTKASRGLSELLVFTSLGADALCILSRSINARLTDLLLNA